MASTPDQRILALGLSRFGLGPRPGDLRTFGADPIGALKEEVSHRAVAVPDAHELMTSARAFVALRELQADRREARRDDTKQKSEPAAGMQAGQRSEPGSEGGEARGRPGTPAEGALVVKGMIGEPPLPQRLYRAEAVARIKAAMEAGIGLGERLVWFWSNHFAVAVGKGPPVRVSAGAFEREAVRPHVFGRFADMLLAVERHPTMLFYLDNQLSIGPRSAAGQRRGRGLNENLARETLELHTLGVQGGYSQADVTALARILTGWTIAGAEGRLGEPGTFVFNPNWHEPGAHKVLGRTYGEGQADQGESVLRDLARHPATAQHIATKLVRHFVADEPPPALVGRLAKVFTDTDGDLGAVSRALVEAPEAWSGEARKLRSPQEFLVAALRLFGRLPEAPAVIGALNAMGQPLWDPPGPNGFADTIAHWASPEGMKTRLDFSAQVGRRAALAEPAALLEDALGPMASAEVRAAVTRAESRPQAIALLLMSPEFQRR